MVSNRFVLHIAFRNIQTMLWSTNLLIRFFILLKINNDNWDGQNKIVGICNREVMCFFVKNKRTFKYHSREHFSKK
jgi:hypothetical protein